MSRRRCRRHERAVALLRLLLQHPLVRRCDGERLRRRHRALLRKLALRRCRRPRGRSVEGAAAVCGGRGGPLKSGGAVHGRGCRRGCRRVRQVGRRHRAPLRNLVIRRRRSRGQRHGRRLGVRRKGRVRVRRRRRGRCVAVQERLRMLLHRTPLVLRSGTCRRRCRGLRLRVRQRVRHCLLLAVLRHRGGRGRLGPVRRGRGPSARRRRLSEMRRVLGTCRVRCRHAGHGLGRMRGLYSELQTLKAAVGTQQHEQGGGRREERWG